MVTDFLKKHWKKIAFVLLIALAFAGGRFSTSGPQIIETEKVVEKKVIDTDAMEKEISRRVEEIKSKMEVKTEIRWVTKPDGTKEVTKTEVAKTETEKKTTEDKVKTVEVVKKEYVDRIVEKEKIITPPSMDYKVGLFIGTQVTMQNYQPEFTRMPVLVGVSASRRLLGPVFLDATLFVGVQPVGVTQLNAVGVTLGASAIF